MELSEIIDSIQQYYTKKAHSGLKSNHASAVRFSPYKVKLRLAGNDEIKFKTVLQDQRNESDRACARAMFCWPVSCDEFSFLHGIYQLLC